MCINLFFLLAVPPTLTSDGCFHSTALGRLSKKKNLAQLAKYKGFSRNLPILSREEPAVRVMSWIWHFQLERFDSCNLMQLFYFFVKSRSALVPYWFDCHKVFIFIYLFRCCFCSFLPSPLCCCLITLSLCCLSVRRLFPCKRWLFPHASVPGYPCIAAINILSLGDRLVHF